MPIHQIEYRREVLARLFCAPYLSGPRFADATHWPMRA